MFIVNYRKIFYLISILLVLASVFSVYNFGLNFGIDFTGGAILEVEYSGAKPDIDAIKEQVKIVGLKLARIQETGERGVIIRAQTITKDEHQRLLAALGSSASKETEFSSGITEKRFDSIGPIIGEELKQKAWIAVALVVIMIVIFISFAFRGVSRLVSSWKYGLVAIIALLHDIVIPVGIFAYIGAEIDVLFVTALLAILGFSVNDTIVVFDRIRENLKSKISNKFSEIVGLSLRQTIARSVNTSLTTLVVLGFLFFVGSSATKMFSLALSIGVVAGTYSSIFLASPLLATIQKLQKK